jgi:hypothetical protein
MSSDSSTALVSTQMKHTQTIFASDIADSGASVACYWRIVRKIVGGKSTEIPLRQAARRYRNGDPDSDALTAAIVRYFANVHYACVLIDLR